LSLHFTLLKTTNSLLTNRIFLNSIILLICRAQRMSTSTMDNGILVTTSVYMVHFSVLFNLDELFLQFN